MVAIVSGNGLGLFNTSVNTLGVAGKFGQGNLGQAGGQSYVNAANGNLVLQFQDEHLSGAAADLNLIRTYNAQGLLNDGDNDNWRFAGESRVSLAGVANQAGSSVSRVTSDGHVAVYSWDATKALYISREGGGAVNTITYFSSSNEWFWQDGSSHAYENYSSVTGLLLRRSDKDGNTTLYQYDANNRLRSITDKGTLQQIVFTYEVVTGTALTRLTRVDTYTLPNDANGRATTVTGPENLVMMTQVKYGYDSSGRLLSVTTDLTPDVATDEKIYVTTYTYDGSSFRVASVSQSDGTTASYTYYSDGKVKTVTDANGVQTFTYSTLSTTVTNGLNQAWTYSYDSNGQLLKVQSPSVNGQSLVTSYQYNTNGDVIQITDGLGNGISYEYDANGNRTLERDPAGNTVTRVYSNYNELLSETRYRVPDSDGSGPLQPSAPETTRYVYATGQMYAPIGQLCYVISAEGRVTQYQHLSLSPTNNNQFKGLLSKIINYTDAVYDVSALSPSTQLTYSQLSTWVAAQDKTKIQLTENSYDYRGNLNKSVQYSTINADGTGGDYSVAQQYIYDAYGHLVQIIKLNGPLNSTKTGYNTIYAAIYDGLGRQLSLINQNGTTITTYDDAKHQIKITSGNIDNNGFVSNGSGMVSLTNYDSYGRVVSVAQSQTNKPSIQTNNDKLVNASRADVAITTNYYNAIGQLAMVRNASGDCAYNFYDVAGRLQYTVDYLGAVSENVYDSDSHLIQKISYATLASTSTWFNGINVLKTSLTKGLSGTDIISDSVNDRSINYIYDSADRLVYTVDASNVVSENIYDGENHLVQTIQHVNALASNSSLSYATLKAWSVSEKNTSAQLLASGGKGLDDRITRYFYDKDGLQIATLDADGYLTESVYRVAGQLRKTIRHAIQIAEGVRANDLATLKINLSSPDDLAQYYYYDNAGRVVGTVSEKGVFTEVVYNNILRNEITNVYMAPVSVNDADTLASIKVRAGLPEAMKTVKRDGFGRVTSETTVNGTTTLYLYDSAGRLYQTVTGEGQTEIDGSSARRAHFTVFDDFGRVITELGAQNEVSVGHAPASPEAIGYYGGVTKTYDVMGNVTSTRDEYGNRSFYYYDADGRLIYTIKPAGAIGEGEVTQFDYNTFGQIKKQTRYTNRLVNISALTGGRADASLITSINALSVTATDQVVSYQYNKLGFLQSKTDEEKFVSTYLYNIFGKIDTDTETIKTGITVKNKHEYDRRGEEVKTTRDVGGLAVVNRVEYDAFGRIINSYDGLNKKTHYQYDNGGRIITVTDALNRNNKTEYDVFNRVLNSYDRNSQITQYSYDDINRTIKVTTPENISVTTYKTRYGETLKMIDGRNNTSVQYSYNKLGEVIKVVDGLGKTISQTSYNDGGRVYETIDARGIVTHYDYDAANRVMRRTVDKNGLAIKTKYEYDSFGSQLRVTQAEGLVEQEITEFHYDRKGLLNSVVVDPSGLALQTSYTYDGLGNTLTVAHGTVANPNQQVIQYQYDKLNRRTGETADPSSLNITTQYKYDADGRLTRKIDANNHSTWYIYNDVGQQIYVIDAEGAVAQTDYDVNGRILKTTSYAKKIVTTSLGDIVNTISTPTDSKDQKSYFVYDKDGRARFTLQYVDNGNWAVNENIYDANSNVIEKRAYDTYLTDVNISSLTSNNSKNIIAAADVSALLPASSTHYQHRTRYIYDTNNRLHYVINPSLYINENVYDNAGNLIQERLFSYHFRETDLLNSGVTDSGISSMLVAQRANQNNQVRTYYYDSLNRKSYQVDAEGYITKFEYYATGNVKTQTLFAESVTLPVDPNVIPTPSATPNKDQVVSYQYDSNNRIIKKTDGEGYITKYSYDSLGNLLETDQALDVAATKWASTYHYYDNAGRERFTISAENHLIEKQYDSVGNLTNLIVYDDAVVIPALGANPTPVNPTKKHVTNYQYNNINRVKLETKALGNLNIKTQYDYDAFGNKLTVTEALGTVDQRITSFTYDAANRLVDTIQKVNANYSITTHLEYDQYGNMSKRTEGYGTADQRIYYFYYNNRNFLYSTKDATGISSYKSFDAAGNVYLEQKYGTSSEGISVYQSTYHYYDRNNHLISTTDPEGGVTQYTYDSAGNQTSIINADLDPLLHTDFDLTLSGDATLSSLSAYYLNWRKRLGIVDFHYSDNLHPELQGKPAQYLTDADKALITARCTISYTYDRANRVSSATDAMGTITKYTYDGAGNKLTTAQSVGVTKEERLTQYEYNKENHLTKVTDPLLYVTKYEYDALGNQTKIIDANNVIRINNYDVLGRLISTVSDVDISNASSGISIKTVNAYDNRGNLKTVTQSFANGSDSRITSYSYDLLNRQIIITDGEGFSTQTVYDDFGNQKSVTKGLYLIKPSESGYDGAKSSRAFPITTLFTYDGDNHILTMTDGVSNISTFKYDGVGNRISETQASNGLNNTIPRTTLYRYDLNNRLVELDSADGGCTIYTFDKIGNKISEKILQSGVVSTGQNYFYTLKAGDQLEWGWLANKLYGTSDVANQLKAQLNNPNLAVGLTLTPLPVELDTSYQTTVNVNPYYVIPTNPNPSGNVTGKPGALTWENIMVELYGTDAANAYNHDDLYNLLKSSLKNGQTLQAGSRLTGLADGITVKEKIPPYYIIHQGDTWSSIATRLYPGCAPSHINDVVLGLIYKYHLGSLPVDVSLPPVGTHLENLDLHFTVSDTAPDSQHGSNTFDLDKTWIIDYQWHDYSLDKSKIKTTDIQTFIVPHMLSIKDVGANIWIVNKFEYDSNRNLTASIDANNVRTEHDYDTRGNITETRFAVGTTDQRKIDSIYDINDRKIQDLDGYGKITKYDYDGMGNRIKVTDALNGITHYYYDHNNRLIEVIDPENAINAFAYDSAGNRTQENVYWKKFNGTANDYIAPIALTDTANDRLVVNVYDRVNQLITQTDADKSVTKYIYNGAENIIRKTAFATAAVPRVTDYSYYTDGHLRSQTDNTDKNDITIVEYTYDGAGNVKTQKVSNTRITTPNTNPLLTLYADPHSIRLSEYDYDLKNRLVNENFKDEKSNLLTSKHTSYDLAGNIVKTDVAMTTSHNQTRRYEYDLANRMVKSFDELGLAEVYGYDSVGNKTSITDHRGNTTNYVYDQNNRQIKVVQPLITIHALGGTDKQIRPTTKTVYDDVGNIIQIIDARAFTYNLDGTVNNNVAPQGYFDNRYYDHNHRITKEIKYVSGSGVNTQSSDCEYSYNVDGSIKTKTEFSAYLTGLYASGGDGSKIPLPSVSNSDQRRDFSYDYDLAGRLTVAHLPAIKVTTVDFTDQNNPKPTVKSTQLIEKHEYDSYGNEIKYTDRGGNATYSYYDAYNRKIALVDPTGYLTAWKYDSVGNQIEQGVYTIPVDLKTLTDKPPMPGSGDVYVTSKEYDAASRLTKVTAPAIDVSPNLDALIYTLPAPTNYRPVISYTYDMAGNMLSQSQDVFGGPQKLTTRYYYNDANQKLIEIGSNRVLQRFDYNENGSVVLKFNYFNTVDSSKSLDVDISTLYGYIQRSDQDQGQWFHYDALNRVDSQADLMNLDNNTDNIYQYYGYDAVGNQTSNTDGNSRTTESVFNGQNKIVQNRLANGTNTYMQYDAVGNMTYAYTGITANLALPASNDSVSFDTKLNVSWQTQVGTQTSWVVYDTKSHTDSEMNLNQLSTYAASTSAQSSIDSSYNTRLNLPQVNSSLYYRIITQDAGGNYAWTAEKSITMPPRMTKLDMVPVNSNSADIVVTFDGTINNAKLVNISGAVIGSFLSQGNNTYKASLTNNDLGNTKFAIQWTTTLGQIYTSSYTSISQTAEADAFGYLSTIKTVSSNTNGVVSKTIAINTNFPQSYLSKTNVVSLQAKWRLTNTTGNYAATGVSGLSVNNNISQFNLVLGSGVSLQANSSYDIILTAIKSNGDEIPLDTFSYTVDSTDTTRHVENWKEPVSSGNDQIVLVNEQPAKVTRQQGRIVVADNVLLKSGDNSYKAYYGTRVADQHTFSLTPTIVNGKLFGVTFTISLSANEAANMSANSLTLGFYNPGSTVPSLMSAKGNNVFEDSYSVTGLDNSPFEIAYVDKSGFKVVVERGIIKTNNSAATFTSQSLTILEQVNGKINFTDANTPIVVTQNLHQGTIDVASMMKDIHIATVLTNTSHNGSKNNDDTGNFISVTYNALNDKIAAVEQDGNLRTYGLNASGVVVETDIHDKTLAAPNDFTLDMSTFNRVDARGRILSQYGQLDTIPSGKRAVTSYTYDVMDHQTSVQLSGMTNKWLYQYNAMGILIQTIDPMDGVTVTEFSPDPKFSNTIHHGVSKNYIDQFGHIVASIANGGAYTSRKFYDLNGNLIREMDADSVVTSYQYDSFGRMVRKTDGRGSFLAGLLPPGTVDNTSEVLNERRDLGVVYAGTTNAKKTADLTLTGENNDFDKLMNAHSTRYVYDNRNRLVKVYDAEGWALSYSNNVLYQSERDRLSANFGFSSGTPANKLLETDRRKLQNWYSTTYEYDNNNNRKTIRTGSQDSYQAFVYDELNRITDKQFVHKNESGIVAAVKSLKGVVSADYSDNTTHEITEYDQYGNVILTIDAEGRSKRFKYSSYGRLSQSFDEDATNTDIKDYSGVMNYYYDGYGRLTRKLNSTQTSDIENKYDNLGRVVSITDKKTSLTTAITYNLLGQRVHEQIYSQYDFPLLENRNPTQKAVTIRVQDYAYDDLGQMTRWAVRNTYLNDSREILSSENYRYDDKGRKVRIFSDDHSVDHQYFYTLSNRFTAEYDYSYVDGKPPVSPESKPAIKAYTYDKAGNRLSYTDEALKNSNYSYDANNRVVSATGSQGTQTWIYDAHNNVQTYSNSSGKTTVTVYDAENRALAASSYDTAQPFSWSVTSTAYDRSGRANQIIVDQWTHGQLSVSDYKSSSNTYSYSYYGDGREKNITVTGSGSGSTTTHYDANKNKSIIVTTASNDMNHLGRKAFIYDSEGHILYMTVDTGKTDDWYIRTEYFYANGNPVGEAGFDTRGNYSAKFDTGVYSEIQNYGETNPGVNSNYVVRSGDTLQSIANAFYGDASLWYIIADANNLNDNSQLTSGLGIKVPSVTRMGQMTANSHLVYNESNIIGSTLPTPWVRPPSADSNGCETVTMIIVLVAVTVAASVATAGVGGAIVGAVGSSLASGALGAVEVAGIYAGVGAAIGVGSGALKHEILTSEGMSDDGYSWQDNLFSGALSGASMGFAKYGEIAGEAGELSNLGKVGIDFSAGLTAAAAVYEPTIGSDIRSDSAFKWSWSQFASAGFSAAGSVFGAHQSFASGETAYLNANGNMNTSAKVAIQMSKQMLFQNIGFANQAISPFVTTAFKEWDHAVDPNHFNGATSGDWWGAVDQSIAAGVDYHFAQSAANDPQLLTQSASKTYELMVKGASHILTSTAVSTIRYSLDGDATTYLSNIQNTVGHEIGNFIGGEINLALSMIGRKGAPDTAELEREFLKEHSLTGNTPQNGASDEEINSYFVNLAERQKEDEFLNQIGAVGREGGASQEDIDAYFGDLAAQQNDDERIQALTRTVTIGRGDTISGLVRGGESNLSSSEIAQRMRVLTQLNLAQLGKTGLNNISVGTELILPSSWADSNNTAISNEANDIFFASAQQYRDVQGARKSAKEALLKEYVASEAAAGAYTDYDTRQRAYLREDADLLSVGINPEWHRSPSAHKYDNYIDPENPVPAPPVLQSMADDGSVNITDVTISAKVTEKEIVGPSIFGTMGKIEKGDLIGYGKGAWNAVVDFAEFGANYGGPLQLALRHHFDFSAARLQIAPDEQSGALIGELQNPLLAAAGGALEAGVVSMLSSKVSSLASEGYLAYRLNSAPVGATAYELSELGATDNIVTSLTRSRVSIFGHGEFYTPNGYAKMPFNSSVTFYTPLGGTITNELGMAIDSGESLEGLFSIRHTDEFPNITILPKQQLIGGGNSITVTEPTLLSELIKPGVDYHIAACSYVGDMHYSPVYGLSEDIARFGPPPADFYEANMLQGPTKLNLNPVSILSIPENSNYSNALSISDNSNYLRGLSNPANDNSFSLESALGNRRLYSSHEIRQELVNTYGAENVTSTTVPDLGLKNVRLAGREHPLTGVPFNLQGLAIFDDIAIYDTKLPIKEFRSLEYTQQMQMATRDLASAIQRGQVDSTLFSSEQLGQIAKGSSKIEGYTWHHHQDTGRMQLIDELFHLKTGHMGWESMSGGR